ncbi:MAG TPA: hypothetical protein DCM08_10015 [Microscillaceae bacterium]|jgi:hypothetical protein|nr:hypothetical protein [Microscillaceae bacterium]
MHKPADWLSSELIEAVINCQAVRVRALLEEGANPNIQLASADPTLATNILQPRTPLQMVVFRISDALLKPEEALALETITKLLLASGADPEPARQLALQRYGAYQAEAIDPKNPLDNIRKLMEEGRLS